MNPLEPAPGASLIVARHGETRYGAAGLLNGDPSVEVPLTEAGEAQARALGTELRDVAIDLCVTTEFARTQRTADLALTGRGVPRVVVAELNDPPVGEFEGTGLAAYFVWMGDNDWSTRPPGGGESQLDSVRRFHRGWHRVLDYEVPRVLVIAHAFPIAVGLTLSSASGPMLRRRYDVEVPYARPFQVERDALRAGLDALALELSANG